MNRFRRDILLTLLCLCLPMWAQAHPLAPALLELQHQTGAEYSVLWRVSTLQPAGAQPQPQLPTRCVPLTAPQLEKEPGTAIASRWQVDCGEASLVGEHIEITQLSRSNINVILRVHSPDGTLHQALLDAGTASYTVPLPSRNMPVFQHYLGLGIEHLLLGPDHLLFLLSLIMIVGMRRRLILTLTAFTLGHSITLTLASLGIIQANAALMELGIALSLVVAARELLRKTPSLFGRYSGSMAAAFGLLHGMGFAGALADIGLPQGSLFQALLAFNVGIELAQLLIVLALFILLKAITPLGRPLAPARHWASPVTAAYLTGSIAMYWCLERFGLLWQV